MFSDPQAAPFFLPGSNTGVLLLHGFTSTPQSVRYVGESLHSASGATVLAPLLKGHGSSPEDLGHTCFLDWLGSAEEALEELGKHCGTIVAAGLSLGGTLALNMAIRHPDKVRAVTTINGSTGLYSAEHAAKFLETDSSSYFDGIGSDIRDETAREICYDRIPAKAIRERYFLTLSTGMMLPLLKQPILILQSRTDHVVDPRNAERIARECGSTDIRLRWLENSFHVATLDHDKDLIVNELATLLSRCNGVAG
ncbi:hypothetical protein B0E33_18610 [Roseibium algicola]|uniref:Carboxylesterase n=1 Tax=Roseibium algicola TaxID=2857014 RepID=A0ABN4WUG9_9HYPH|nr:alpha/beta fold hydrolase [Roseibium aggregatum]AQQ05340.1 hypothetical protein B0E33_18610 [Roseibium aggregatum]